MLAFRLVVFTLFHLLAWAVLRGLWPSTRGWRGFAVFAGVGAALSSLWLVEPVRFLGAVWLVAVVLVVVVGSAFLAIRRITSWIADRRASKPETIDESRRRLLTGAGRAVPVAAVAASGVGVASGLSDFLVRREEIRVKGLPAGLDGFRIGQLTDVHVGPFVRPHHLARAVDTLNAEGVDLQVMTGDLIDDVDQLDGTFDALERCQAKHGLVAILGNHEYFRGVEEIVSTYRTRRAAGSQVRLLVDDSERIDHAGTPLRIVGVDFPMGTPNRRSELMRKSADAAFARCEPGETTLCLSHHPDFFTHAAERGAMLTLAGHTHGGQVALGPFALGSLVFRYALGRYGGGDRHLYVSGGTGHWLPFRLGVPAEITVLTLRAA